MYPTYTAYLILAIINILAALFHTSNQKCQATLFDDRLQQHLTGVKYQIQTPNFHKHIT